MPISIKIFNNFVHKHLDIWASPQIIGFRSSDIVGKVSDYSMRHPQVTTLIGISEMTFMWKE
jgi:hypothetical protein